MLEKTYRVLQIMSYYSDCNGYATAILKEVTRCYIEGLATFSITCDDFERYIDEKVSPADAVEAMTDVNSLLCYTFTFTLEYKDSESWWIDAEMIERVWFRLDSEI